MSGRRQPGFSLQTAIVCIDGCATSPFRCVEASTCRRSESDGFNCLMYLMASSVCLMHLRVGRKPIWLVVSWSAFAYLLGALARSTKPANTPFDTRHTIDVTPDLYRAWFLLNLVYSSSIVLVPLRHTYSNASGLCSSWCVKHIVYLVQVSYGTSFQSIVVVKANHLVTLITAVSSLGEMCSLYSEANDLWLR